MIGTSLYTLLSGHAPLTALVGTNIFPVRVPQEVENPVVCFGITKTEPQETKQFVSSEDWTDVELIIYSDDYDLSHQIASEVRAALDKNRSISGISDIVFQDFEDGWEDARQCYAPILKFLVIAAP
jgi:hypothetical protein